MCVSRNLSGSVPWYVPRCLLGLRQHGDPHYECVTFFEAGCVWMYNKDRGLYKCLRADHRGAPNTVSSTQRKEQTDREQRSSTSRRPETGRPRTVKCRREAPTTTTLVPSATAADGHAIQIIPGTHFKLGPKRRAHGSDQGFKFEHTIPLCGGDGVSSLKWIYLHVLIRPQRSSGDST